MSLLAIRQSSNVAVQIVELFGDTVRPELRNMMEKYFELEVKQNGKLSVEFLQGFFSGLFFANSHLLDVGVEQQKFLIVTDLAIEAARKYLEQIEENLKG